VFVTLRVLDVPDKAHRSMDKAVHRATSSTSRLQEYAQWVIRQGEQVVDH
jgi:hypothetical protein